MGKKEMYEKYHRAHANYGVGAIHIAERLGIIIRELQPKSILDYGCGKGRLVEYLRKKYQDIEVCGYDPAVKEFAILPKRKFDLITCTDVLEHIPEDELIESVERIASMSDNVYFLLNHGPSPSILENGENAHCTIKSPAWYYDVFKSYFHYSQYLPAERDYTTACITFRISESSELEYYRLTDIAIREVVNKYISRNNLLHSLLTVDWTKFNTQRYLALYGFGNTCKEVYSIIKNKCKVRCFVDIKEKGYYDDVPVMYVDDYKSVDGEVVIVFPEYDFDKIKATILPKLNQTNDIFKASEFFCKLSNGDG